jgi:beta-glucosidase
MALRINPDHESRIDSLLEQMTLEEKVGQMVQMKYDQTEDGALLRAGRVGSIILATSPWAGNEAQPGVVTEQQNEIQRLAVEESHLGIPVLFGRDVIHGYRTVFPIPLGQAATFSPKRVEEGAAVAAREARSVGIAWTFAPMMDIGRDPRWGRVAEGYGEDPHLCCEMARAAVRGFQGDDLSDPNRMLACAKHFAAYGGAEGGRDYDTVDISERTLREIYLRSFRAAVEEGVGTFMSSFNEIGGIPSTGNKWLLSDVLRGEWGFEGFVVSDWASTHEMRAHGIAADDAEAACLAANAGLDMDMVNPCYHNHLQELVEAGKVSMETIDAAVRRILRCKLALGLFEAPYTGADRSKSVVLCKEHQDAARACARDAVILLKNENDVLPLSKEAKGLAVLGPLMDVKAEIFGTWTPDGVSDDAVPILDGIRAAASDQTQIFVSGPSVTHSVGMARKADAAILVMGEVPQRSGEANSISTLDLPPTQREFVEALRVAGVPIVLVILSGRPLSIEKEVEWADAVLFSFHPGLQGGPAIADILFGDANPAGRLPMTMPRTVGQIPIYYNHKNTGRPYGGDPYRMSRYRDCPRTPLFPFGYGLSYTTFEYDELKVSPEKVEMDQTVTVQAQVTNTGARAGDEVVQLYVRDLLGSVSRPVKELKGFERIHLEPGEKRLVAFSLKAEDLAFYDREMNLTTEPGEFQVWVGPNSAEGLEGRFELLG